MKERNRNKTQIMGILNVTPDSFSDGGKYDSTESAVLRAKEMIQEGADIIDIGGESTRPNAPIVSTEDELKRVISVIEKIKSFVSNISIDTSKSEVAQKAIEAGATIVNDIYGLQNDKDMAQVVAKNNVKIIIMHIKGTPENMQNNPEYKNVIDEINDYFQKSISIAESAGINREEIVLDPGIGFGKTVKDNLDIIKNIRKLAKFEIPIMLGVSRKSFIGKITGAEVENRLAGSIASITIGIMNGVDIVRVHDVKETKQAVEIIDRIIGKE
ncbi:MAG: dihydropteroate synthase [Candidatus Marinimicrobia bacterium]|nr:dihydropteroate synthase [Candidatus Neomarinimicrobiota bacterium]